MEMIQVAKS
jgi:hypothetical protein